MLAQLLQRQETMLGVAHDQRRLDGDVVEAASPIEPGDGQLEQAVVAAQARGIASENPARDNGQRRVPLPPAMMTG